MAADPYDVAIDAVTPAQNDDRYLSVIDQLQAEDKSILRSSISSALQVNPDQYAKARSLSAETGIPAPVVHRNLDQVSRQATVDKYDQLLDSSPAISRMLRDPEFAKIAHDDVENLSAFERLLSAPENIGRSVIAGGQSLSAGMYGLGEIAGTGLNRYMDLAAGREPGRLDPITRWFKEQRSGINAAADAQMAQATRGAGYVETNLLQGMRSVGSQIPAYIGAILTRNPGVALTIMGLQTGGNETTRALDKGVNFEQALTYGVTQSLVEVGTERLPLVKVIDDLTAGTPFWKMVLGNQMQEQWTEQVATHLQDLNEWVVLHPEASLRDYMEARPEAALSTAISTFVASGTLSSAIYGFDKLVETQQDKQMRIAQAEQGKRFAERLTELATESKVRERAPAEFESALAEAMAEAPVTEVIIDAQKLGELYQDQVGSVLADVGISEQEFAQASLEGRDIRVPISTFAARLAAKPETKAMLDHIRFTEGGYSAAEAKAAQKEMEADLQRDTENLLKEVATDEVTRASMDAVVADVKQRLSKAAQLSPAVAESNATYVAAWYSKLAASEGITPQEAYAKYPFNLANERLPGIVLEQGGVSLEDWTRGDGNPNFGLHIADAGNVAAISAEGLKAARDGYVYLWNSHLDAETQQIMTEARQSRGMTLDEATAAKDGYFAVDLAKVADRIETDPYTGEKRVKGDIPPDAIRHLSTELNQGPTGNLDQTYAAENRVGVTVGGKPGQFGWTFSSGEAAPPVEIPTQKGPRLNIIGDRVHQILISEQFTKLAEDLFGIKGLRVTRIEGSWMLEPEPAFALQADEMTFEQASRLSRLLGFAFAQEAAVVTQPFYQEDGDGIPAAYIGAESALTPEQLDRAKKAAKDAGLDYSTTVDRRGLKFLYFGDEAGLGNFVSLVGTIADAAGLPLRGTYTGRSELNEAQTYLSENDQGGVGPAWLRDAVQGSPDLFRAVVDHLLVPYARAVGAEGYRFDPERFAERFGLPRHKRDLIAAALRPSDGVARSTAPLLAGTEKLDVQPTGHRGKPNVLDVMWALQNRAATTGQIEPGDYSDEAGEIIAQTIADEIGHHLERKGGKSAIGWYDKALKKAKRLYNDIFPDIKKSTEKAMMFDAFLGVTSQGNDVFANSIYAARMFELVARQGKTIPEAVKQLKGSFGQKTVQIENNLLKFDALLKQNGYLRMRRLFNERKTVGEWNAILRKEERLKFNGEPLEITGAAENEVTGWFVFGPKIGSFINNLHGDYSTLTADLWFSRTWNRILGYSFKYSPDAESTNYQSFVEALLAEVTQDPSQRMKNGKPMTKKGKPVLWEHGKDVVGLTKDEVVDILWEPARVLALAETLEARFRKGGYKGKSDLRRAAKNWIELRENTQELPRGDLERLFQQKTMERAQRLLKKKFGVDITIADMQAALWYHEKELFGKFGVQDKRSAPADYADAAKTTVDAHAAGALFTVKANSKSEMDPSDELFQSAFDPATDPRLAGTKVVDADGQPLRVFHGGGQDIEKFTQEGAAASPVGDTGAFWFSDAPDNASDYAATKGTTRYQIVRKNDDPDDPENVSGEVLETFDTRKEAKAFLDAEVGEPRNFRIDQVKQAPVVYPAYLNLQNPLVLDARGADFASIPLPSEVQTALGLEGEAKTWSDRLAAQAKRAGYDGLIVRNVIDTAGGFEKPQTTYAVFDGKQIVSATSGDTLGQSSFTSSDLTADRLNALTAEQANDLAGWLYETSADVSDQMRGNGPDYAFQDEVARIHQYFEDHVGKFKGDWKSIVDDFVKTRVESKQARVKKALIDAADEAAQSFFGSLNQQNRGAFNPSTRTITLLKDADLSTFLHEFGHFQLEVMVDIASRTDAPQQIVDDVNTLLKWFGVADIATWKAMSLEEQRPSHEKFARGAEAYLMSGESPNAELASVFARFRSWLLQVYKNLKALNVTLTPEVRGVFDRMLASEESIAAYQSQAGYRAIFQSQEESGMTPAQWADYQATGQQSTDDAVGELERKSLKDMQWLANAKSRELSRLQKKVETVRAEMREKVEAEVRRQPVYALREFLQKGTLPEDWELNKTQEDIALQAGMVGSKLSLPSLKAELGEGPAAPWRYLPTGPNGLAATEGLPAQMAVDLFGFRSVDHMVKELVGAAPMEEVVEQQTDQRMLEEHGELTDPKAVERAAEAAIHNAARAKFVAAELDALEAANAAKVSAGVDKKGRRRSVSAIVKAAKDYAKSRVSQMTVKDVRASGRFSTAESRAAKAAEKAFRAGKLEEAAMHKRSQVLANALWSEASKAAEDIDRIISYLRKFNSEGTRKSLDVEYLEQIDTILETLDLRNVSQKELASRQSLRKWIESQQEIGIEPTLDPALVESLAKTHITQMTVEQLRGLRDTVKQIEHLGRLKKKLLTAKDQREFEEVVTGLVESIEKVADGRTVNNRTGTTTADRAVMLFKGFFASHRKFASYARQLDGSQDGGPMWEAFIRTMNEAGDRETTMREQATVKLAALVSALKTGARMGSKIDIPEIGRSLNREQRLAVALNVGNDGNKQRLMSGERWSDVQLQAVLDTLTKEDWDFVQSIWDLFESYRPLIAEKEKRVNGVEPEWIDPVPVQTRFGEYRGGYFPVKYDRRSTGEAKKYADAEDAAAMLRAAYTSTTTRRSFTKARAKEVIDRPLLLSLDGIYQGLNEVIHDLSWHEWLIDATRLLRDKRVDRAIRTAWGADVVNQLHDAMADIGSDGSTKQGQFDALLNHIRVGATVTGLGWNVATSLLQPTGLAQSAVRIGPKWVLRGLMRWTESPAGALKEVYAKSEFMRVRAKTMQREINEIRNQVKDRSKFRNAAEASFFVMITKAQLIADVPTWLGAYEKAIVGGEAEDRAAALADQAVIDSQGGGQIKDLAAIQRGGPAQKLFTNFYSYFNVTYNLAAERARATNFRKPGEVGALAVDYLLLYTLPAVLGSMLKMLLSGDDEDEDSIAKRLIGDQISYLMGTFVGLREATGAMQYLTDTKLIPATYTGPAGLRFFSDLEKFTKQISQGEWDGPLFRSGANVLGTLMHWPMGQVARTVEGAAALIEGRTDNPAVLISGYR